MDPLPDTYAETKRNSSMMRNACLPTICASVDIHLNRMTDRHL